MRRASLLLALGLFAGAAAGSACRSSGAPAATTLDGGGGLPPLEANPPATLPPAAQHDASSSSVLFDAVRGGVWTANGDIGTVSYNDVDAHALIGEIAVSDGAGRGDVRSVALSPDGAWLAAVDRASGTVSLIDPDARIVRRTLAVGGHPRAAIWDAADPRWLYVAVEDIDAVAIIDRTLGVLARTLPVGRLPSGLAVSRKRPELYVSHRIDPSVSIVDLGQGRVVANVPFADEPANLDRTVPQGKPFAFEGIAWQPDGDVAWVPHELLAPTHPFQFQSTVFPAVSVLDLSARAEVENDPASGDTSGRKLLFGAIDIPDAMGNTSIVSQPCAIVVHPNDVVAYALACGSEDLLTFDMTTGLAIGLLRNLPGDHPSGITLDDTGQRAFILSDGSHTLLSLDIAGGDPVAHARIIDGPRPTFMSDPVDPELRAGQKLFFGANSAKNDLATTGNDWLSCGACHLDGFGSGTRALFDDAHPVDPTTDALIGHVALKDDFSSAATPADPSFDPHDVLVALLNQGGLSPDRTGVNGKGSVDPSAPTPTARLMASRIARVIARDLPLGPSWLSSSSPPAAANDTTFCKACHQAEYQTWSESAHAHAGADPMVRFDLGIEQKNVGPAAARLCAGCHDPVDARSGDPSLSTGRGVTCLSCHEVAQPIRAAGNADLVAVSYDWTVDHASRAHDGLETLRRPDFCGGCHEQFVPGTGLTAISTLREYGASPFAGHPTDDAGLTLTGASTCVDCHMAANGGTGDHSFIGGNVYVAQKLGDGSTVPALRQNLSRAVSLAVARAGSGYLATLTNHGAGHSFPTGVTDIREPWIELEAMDAQKHVLARFGGPDASGLLPPDAARFGTDIAAGDGTVLLHHELSQAMRVTFDRRVPAGQSVDVFLPAPPSLPPGTSEVDAVLLYRNVRTPFYRAATGDATGTAPEVEVARAKAP